VRFRFTNITAKAGLATTGLILMTGLAAAPAAAADHAPHERSAAHSAADQTTADTRSTMKATKPAEKAANAADQPAEKPTNAADKPADKPAAAADNPSGPPMDQLIGRVQGEQQRIPVSPEQMANVRSIVDAGKQLNLPDRAAVIAVATSLQESKLENLGHLGDRNDHDSLGLFQQRPSSGWGTPEQITDPNYSAKAFYEGLQNVPGYDKMPLTEAAQTVQVSAFPDAYAQWEQMAADLVLATYHAGPYADIK